MIRKNKNVLATLLLHRLHTDTVPGCDQLHIKCGPKTRGELQLFRAGAVAEPVLQDTDNEARVTQFWIGVGGGRLNRALKGRLGYSRVLKDSAMVLPPFAAPSLPMIVLNASLYYLPS